MQMLENKAKCSVHPELEDRMFDEIAQVYDHYKFPTHRTFHNYVMPILRAIKMVAFVFWKIMFKFKLWCIDQERFLSIS